MHAGQETPRERKSATGSTGGVLGEHRGDRRVDPLLGFRTGQAVETLLYGRMPQRLTALRVVQIHRNDPFAVDVGIPAPAPAVGIAVFHDGVPADAVAHQAVGAGGSRLNATRSQMRGDGSAQAVLIQRNSDGAAQRTVTVERTRSGKGVAGPGPVHGL